MTEAMVQVAWIVPHVTILGPGSRIGLWVAGCPTRCPGCMTPELFSPKAGRSLAVSWLARKLRSLAPAHRGVTISGGEPFQQAFGLARLLEELRATTDLDVLVYSGFALEEILAGGAEALALLAQVDVLVDGRYVESQPTSSLWRGSANQRIHLLTDRARSAAAWTEPHASGERNLQLWQEADGRFLIVGIPERNLWKHLEAEAVERGLRLSRASQRSES